MSKRNILLCNLTPKYELQHLNIFLHNNRNHASTFKRSITISDIDRLENKNKRIRLENGYKNISGSKKLNYTHFCCENVSNLSNEILTNDNPINCFTSPLYTNDSINYINQTSRVVHIRNIPSDMTELELIYFCKPFGKLSNYLILKGRNQAFVEYINEESAHAIVHISKKCPLSIRAHAIFCQYSTHRELKTLRKSTTKEGSLLGNGWNCSSNCSSDAINDMHTFATNITATSNLQKQQSQQQQLVVGQKRAHSVEDLQTVQNLSLISGSYAIPKQLSSSLVEQHHLGATTTAAFAAVQQHQQQAAAALYVAAYNNSALYGTLVQPQLINTIDTSNISKRSRLSTAIPNSADSIVNPLVSYTQFYTPNFLTSPSYFAIQQQQQQQATAAAIAAAITAGSQMSQHKTQMRTHLNINTQKQQKTVDQAISLKFNDTENSSNLLILSGSKNDKDSNNENISEFGGTADNSSTSASQLDISGSGTQQQPNTVLRVIIDNMLYAITLDMLHSIFSRYGKVLKIITFNKNNTFQALIQMNDASAAQNARHGLDGLNVYNGCCTLRIDYSKLSTLNVKYNNDKSRDYTNPNLSNGEINFEQQLSFVTGAASQNQLSNHINSIISHNPFMSFPLSSATNSFFQNQQTLLPTTDVINSAANVAAAAAAVAAMSSTTSAGHNASNIPPFFNFGAVNTAAAAAGAANNSQAATAATLNFPQLANLIGSPVILVSNLDEKKITPDALFTLFGVYGDVHRVKILFNRKDSALIQFAEPQQAFLATQHLDKVKWNDKIIRITSSKHTNVQMPKEGQPDSGLTRDYINSSLHRFKKPGSKNYMNIYGPSSTLHLSNIPTSITEQFLINSFEEKGFPVKMLKFFQNDHKMALVQLESIDQAISALTQMHNFKLADNAHLRVSFSKKGINVETR